MEDKSTVFSWVADKFGRRDHEIDEETATVDAPRRGNLHVHHNFAYKVTVRLNVTSFQDAVIAADGLQNGEAQVLNLSQTPVELREKIKDFMYGCYYIAGANMEVLGENVYLYAPSNADIKVVRASSRED